mgnify:CR=1 FL=1
MAVILITQGQRKIPIQYAKRIVGRKIYGGQSTYIPLRVNQSGVIPIIFAQSIILFPATIASVVSNPIVQKIASAISERGIGYNIVYSLFIIFFCYFYAAITFNPIDVAENMKRYGGFVPGIRPGKATAEFLDYVMTRITLPGAVFLSIIAIIPTIISHGGTSLLMVVGVMLDTMQQVESHLITRHYEGFMKRGRIKGRR